MTETHDPALDEWRTYDEFAAGIDTYRLPTVSLAGTRSKPSSTTGLPCRSSSARRW